MIKNQNGVTIVALVVIIVVMIILARVSLSVIMPQNSVIDTAYETRIRTKIATIEEKLNAIFLDEINIDNKIDELVNEDYLVRIVNNSSNQELYWITKKGIEKFAKTYSSEIDDELVKAKCSINDKKIEVNSLDDLLETNCYVIDRELKISYISDKIYGQAEFKTPEIERTGETWWRAEN